MHLTLNGSTESLALFTLVPILHPMNNSSNRLQLFLEHYQYNRQYLSRVPQVHYPNARS